MRPIQSTRRREYAPFFPQRLRYPRLQPNEIQQLQGYDASVDEWERADAFVPRYNIAPHTQAPVLRRRAPNDSTLVLSSVYLHY